MNVIAIHSLPDNKEPFAGALARALGITMHEALMRLRLPGGGPFVVSVLADNAKADALSRSLSNTGFQVILAKDSEIEKEANAKIARGFEFNAGSLHFDIAGENGMDIPYKDIIMILRGFGSASSTDTITEKSREFSLGAAVASSGLKMFKTVESKHTVTTEQRLVFVRVYTSTGHIIACYEKSMSFNSLGADRKYSSLENINYFVSRLRQSCSNAVYDDRLLNMAKQAALLGPTLSPETHILVATALLLKALIKKA